MPITKSDRDIRFLLELGVPLQNIAEVRAGRTTAEVQAELSAPSETPRSASPTPPAKPTPRRRPRPR